MTIEKILVASEWEIRIERIWIADVSHQTLDRHFVLLSESRVEPREHCCSEDKIAIVEVMVVVPAGSIVGIGVCQTLGWHDAAIYFVVQQCILCSHRDELEISI